MVPPNNPAETDGYWQSPDELRLHYRDHAGGADGRPAMLCLPGLTRNARDFAGLAARIAPAWRTIAVDFRGRGESAHAPDPMTYVPATYVADVAALLDTLGLKRVVLVGTSLGGIVAMLLAADDARRVAGVVLNDIGPRIEAAGLSRIRGQVGRGGSWPTWLHAARGLADGHGDVYPGYALEDWLAMAKRVYRLNAAGRIVVDYDSAIAEPLRAADGAADADLWPAYDALAGRPVAIVRGARSDILSARTAAEMAARVPDAVVTTVADVGHAPTLDEPAAAAAVDALLARVLAA